ncbi:MAG TPA: ATP-binding cassette domain-containing protein, partial [Thermoanaerobaculia bacterium]
MIEVSRISRRFGRRWALVDISFDLKPGGALLVAGANGSGKSTLFRVLSTAIRPDHGTARIDGHDLNLDQDLVRRASALLTHQAYTYEAL